MAQQIIDMGIPDLNYRKFSNALSVGDAVRHVKIGGDDTEDGKTWATAKASVAAAVDSLPTTGSGGSLHHYGRVEIGSGTFVESVVPIEVNMEISFVGRGTSSNIGVGTIIKLADEANDHLFSYTDAWTEWSHQVVFRDLKLEGNRANQSGTDAISGVNMTFADADPDTIQLASGSWTNYVAGDFIRVSGSASNDGYYEVASASGDLLTLWGDEELAAEGPVGGVTVSRVNFDLIRLRQGGFNCAMYNVFLRDAARNGISVDNTVVNLALYNCTGVWCTHAWLMVNMATSSNNSNVSLFGSQIDNCGKHGCIIIDNQSNGDLNMMGVYGLECEDSHVSLPSPGGDWHDKIIVHRKGGTNGYRFDLHNVSAWKATDTGTAVVWEEGSSGGRGAYAMSNVFGGGTYTKALDGSDTSFQQVSIDSNVYMGIFGQLPGGPISRFEFGDGVALYSKHSNTPEGALTANVGSLCTRLDGGANTTLYVKESGTGNTGWAAK